MERAMQIGTIIKTSDGIGTIKDIEIYSRLGGMKRFGVELEKSEYSYTPVYYFADECDDA